MSSAISIDRLRVVLGGDFVALRDVSGELEEGSITGFIGPSGAGKTTLIRTIVGRQRLTSGQVKVLGEPAGSPGLRARVSYMTQGASVYPDLTVKENVHYFAKMAGYHTKQVRKTCDQVLTAVELTAKAKALVGNLSGGQKQRVSLATALIGDPELLVLDEPTVGLDPVLREQLWELFRTLVGQGKTIIISSHVMDEAERCDDLLLIRDGIVVAHEAPRKLCERTATRTVEQAFLKLAGDKA